jgi:transcriptional regulator with XRE-family HTH domain
MASTTVDVGALYAALDAKRKAGDSTSWREIARELGISPSTFTRLAQGRRPDVDTFATLLQWLGMPAEQFLRTEDSEREAPEAVAMISTYLRADRNLTKEAAESLEELIQVAYRMALQKSRP